ncbi:hypothetical protein SH139x_005839 [Planctomycetaceae bacterium SH139]
MSADRARKRRAIKMSLISGFILLAVLGIVTWLGGRVRGVEFAPTHFTQREFVFWEIPLVHLQVTPIRRKTVSTPTINLLRSKGYLQIPSGTPENYHLVEIQHGYFSQTQVADAEILVKYLQLANSGSPIWETWSRDNPAAAAVFWPVIQRLAERDLYLLIPDLFAIAAQETSGPVLSAAIDTHLQAAYQSLAEDLLAAGHPPMAAAVLRDAQTDFPRNPLFPEMLESLPEL